MKKAFTLAEVLITLGIIGIVAAITMPTLISNYEKRSYASRLAHAYSTLSNAVKLAQVEHGDIATWNYQQNSGKQIEYAGADHQQITRDFVEQYFLPYLKVSKNHGFKQLRELGYEADDSYKTKDGRIYHGSNGTRYYLLEISNGTLLMFYYGTERDSDDNVILSSPYIFIDLNGKKGPNILGRDFHLVTLSTSNNKLYILGMGNTRENLIKNCKKDASLSTSSNFHCGALIMHDGWKVSKDHPW